MNILLFLLLASAFVAFGIFSCITITRMSRGWVRDLLIAQVIGTTFVFLLILFTNLVIHVWTHP